MEVEEDETVLDAAFRQGIMLMHGCKEGQCSACKSILIEGDAEHEDYSTFALSDMEKEEGQVLLCRLYAYSDLEVELLNFDEDELTSWIPAKKFNGTVTAITSLTHDIRQIDIDLDGELTFRAGQYVDITSPGRSVTRSYSMASSPSSPDKLSFIIKIYPDGKFSSLLDNELKTGDTVEINGPFGMSFRNEKHDGPMLLVGGGSGMAPLWSILNDLVESGVQKPVRFYYGARTKSDLFFDDEIAALAEKLDDFEFVPVLSDLDPGDDWSGATGFVHEAVAERHTGANADETMESYACGPPPMVEAVLPVLQAAFIDADNIHLDKFTPAAEVGGH